MEVKNNNMYYMPNEYFSVNSLGRVIEIPMAEIILFETTTKPYRIRLLGQKQVIEFSDKLSKISKKLNRYFYRINKGCIINCDYVESFDTESKLVTLVGGEDRKVTIGRLRGLKSTLMIE